ncbi:3-keto-5-aminohexanoate cleavage protein [Microbacterium sp. Bi121]|uniref:3-keto-5-aminohexanoate cleavage protein n=1 Tax=Microbacterium sp. Bi121 TaxID=2822348 RepID=UPI001E1885FF|nr:3-keto-5-aminohexanoate cleavage protein [Microbacterium sp. Bi121]CAH0123319.1 3-keto-5-aminohexanoate cleavage enzyme [Microbacterium sp. Bi121]
MLIQACVNGARDVAEHHRISAHEHVVATDAARAVAAGAGSIHVHAKDADGRDSLDAGDVARWLTAVRAACSGILVGVTTGAWAAPHLEARLAAIDAWTELPDFASVNWHEDGADEVAALLVSRGVGVEAGAWSLDGAEAWSRSPSRDDCMRVLIELPDLDVAMVRERADALIARIRRSNEKIPLLLHGEGRSTWVAFDLAVERGLDSRIGLEDCLTLPDGSIASGNAALVRAAMARVPVR